MADKDLTINVGAKDSASAVFNKIGGNVDALAKRTADTFQRMEKIGKVFIAAQAGIEGMRAGFDLVNAASAIFDGNLNKAVASVEKVGDRLRNLPGAFGTAAGLGLDVGGAIGEKVFGIDMAHEAKIEAAAVERAKQRAAAPGIAAKGADDLMASFGAKESGAVAEQRMRLKLLGLTGSAKEEQEAANARDKELAEIEKHRSKLQGLNVAAGRDLNAGTEMFWEAQGRVELDYRNRMMQILEADHQKRVAEDKKFREAMIDGQRRAEEEHQRIQMEGAAEWDEGIQQQADQIMRRDIEDQRIEAEANADFFGDAPQSLSDRPGRTNFETNRFLTGYSGVTPALREAKEQTNAMNEMKESFAEVAKMLSDKQLLAVVKGAIRGR